MSSDFKTLDSNGENIKQWRVDLLNSITKNHGHDISLFTNRQGLPVYHTQHPSQRYAARVGGVTIDNMMVDMLGSFKDQAVDLSESEYLKLSPEDQAEISSTISNGKTSRKRYIKINVAAEYTLKYDGDQMGNERVKVSHSDFKYLSKAEATFVGGLASCAASITMYLSQNMKFKMENCETFVENRRLGRTDMMLLDIERMVVSNNAGEVVEPNQFNFSILRVLDQLMALRLGVDASVPQFLLKFDNLYQKLVLLGFGASKTKKPVGEDTLDYMLGVLLVRAVGGPRFDVYITKADADRELRAPTCTYAWANLKVRTWNDEIANGYGAMGKRKTEGNQGFTNAQVKKVKVMMAATYDHKASATKGGTASGNKSAGASHTSKTDGGSTSFKTWKATYECEHCKKKGHFGSECTAASELERGAYLKAAQVKKAKRIAEQGSRKN